MSESVYQRLEREKAMSRGDLILMIQSLRATANASAYESLKQSYLKGARQIMARHSITESEINGSAH